MLSFGKEAFKIQRVWTGHLGRKLFRRLVVAIEEFRFAKASESNAIYKDRWLDVHRGVMWGCGVRLSTCDV